MTVYLRGLAATGARSWSLVLALCLLCPAVSLGKRVTIRTEPVEGGRVLVNGRYVGTAPVTVDIRINKNQPARITAEKEGALLQEAQYFTSQQQTTIVVGLIPARINYTIVTEPVADGRVFVDGDFVGVAPVSVDLSVTKTEPIRITTEKVGAIGAWPRQISPRIADTDTTVVLRLEEDEALQATQESDIANNWLTIYPQRTSNSFGAIDDDKVWQKLVSLVTDSFPDLEQIDRGSYYIRSAWRIRQYPFRVLRHRLVVKRGVSDELTIRVLIESQMAPRSNGSYREEEFEPTRRVFRSDSETIGFLRDQL